MKKFLYAILLSMLLCSVAIAAPRTIDFETMTLKELISLCAEAQIYILASDEWQEVILPEGIYEIGVDIQAGRWTISTAKGEAARINWGKSLNETGTEINYKDFSTDVVISETHRLFEAKATKPHFDLELPEGTFIHVQLGTVVFTPYMGKLLLML